MEKRGDCEGEEKEKPLKRKMMMEERRRRRIRRIGVKMVKRRKGREEVVESVKRWVYATHELSLFWIHLSRLF